MKPSMAWPVPLTKNMRILMPGNAGIRLLSPRFECCRLGLGVRIRIQLFNSKDNIICFAIGLRSTFFKVGNGFVGFNFAHSFQSSTM